MTRTKTTTINPFPTSMLTNHRLKSVDTGHGLVKVCGPEGTFSFQNAYVTVNIDEDDPDNYAIRDDLNRLVCTPSGDIFYYGDEAAASTDATSAENVDKLQNPLNAFYASLIPEDDGQDLIVAWFHWDKRRFDEIEGKLVGSHTATVNGHNIRVNVKKVVPIVEGLGTYYSHYPELQHGPTLLYVFGFGTVESSLITSTGDPTSPRRGNAQTSNDLSVFFNLINPIRRDRHVRAALHCPKASSVSVALIEQYLRRPSIGEMSVESWTAIKSKYLGLWGQKVLDELIQDRRMQSAAHRLCTGGGAQLLRPFLPDELFIIPENAGTACVEGGYQLLKDNAPSLLMEA